MTSTTNKKYKKPIDARGNKNLKDVYADTVAFFNKKIGTFPLASSKEYPFEEDYLENFKEIGPVTTRAMIEVTTEDTFDMALRYKRNKLRPLVLNFANNNNPGGGVRKGSKAQEEDLFRRSNYFQTLNHESVEYPLDKKVVYSPTVYIAKSNDYKWNTHAVRVSCLAVAAIKNPEIYLDGDEERFAEIDDREYMKQAINTIFHVAIREEHDSLVLGALGCGAFRGPRHDIAKIFANALKVYRPFFKRIGFGVLVRNPNDQINFDIFKETIEDL
jgi:uncharacterized protein (TIGR02452 family)